MNLQELEIAASNPEPAGVVVPKLITPKGPQPVSTVYDSKGRAVTRYEDENGAVSLMITSKNQPIVTQEEITEVENWYWNYVGVKCALVKREN
jgi:hypothetical protein